MTHSELKKTPLASRCESAGGKMVDFHGWLLPVQFDGIIAEHKAVREAAGMFDVSHMGQIFVEGKDAWPFLQYINCNKAATQYLPEEFLNNQAVNIPADILGDIEFMQDISPEATEQMNEIWNTFKQS